MHGFFGWVTVGGGCWGKGRMGGEGKEGKGKSKGGSRVSRVFSIKLQLLADVVGG